jgi:phosphate acetyltransferase
MTETEAQRAAKSSLVFAGLMVAAGDADAFVGGAATTTAETFRAAIATIGTRPGTRTVSGVMIVCVYDQVFGASGVIAMADPALIIDPSATQLAEIAIATAETTRAVIGAEPAVALLSFSTKGSAKHPWVEKVREARRVVEARAPQLHIDGELQADAALVEAVGRSKAPGSTVAGHANTLIFPDVASANIGVKLVERLGGAVNTGPFFQGLAKPANDLPRGCSPEDVYRVAIVTALQCG